MKKRATKATFLMTINSVLLAAVGASAAVIDVGEDPDCDYSGLQAAINAAADGDTLRLQEQEFSNGGIINFHVIDKSLELIGGYVGCSGVRGESMSILRGLAAADSTLEVRGSVADVVELRHLVITAGTYDDDFGGGIDVAGGPVLRLYDTVVGLNASARGGGIYVADGSALSLSEGSEVHGNIGGERGGGIACSDAQVTINAPAFVTNNRTDGQGAGLHIENCFVSLLGEGTTEHEVLIEDNVATGYGGGLFVTSTTGNSFVNADGDGASLISIVDNRAGSRGGGIYASGDQVTVHMRGTRLNRNRAELVDVNTPTGGAIYAAQGAGVSLFGGGCTRKPCQEIAGNSGASGAAVAANQATVLLAEAVVRDNHWVEGTTGYSGQAAVASLYNSDFTCRNCLVHGNYLESTGNPRGLFSADGSSGSITLRGSTVAGNDAHDAVIHKSGLSTASVYQSILWDNDGDLFQGNVAFQYLHCAVVPVGPIPNHNSELVFADPQFRADGVDYRLQPTSPAIDACSDGSQAPIFDHLGRARPLGVRWDAGAYEHDPSLLFYDHFESGDTSAWSP